MPNGCSGNYDILMGFLPTVLYMLACTVYHSNGKGSVMQMLERVRRCRFCKSDMTDKVSATAYRENPYCQSCLPERIQQAARKSGPKEIRYVGSYIFASPVAQSVPLPRM